MPSEVLRKIVVCGLEWRLRSFAFGCDEEGEDFHLVSLPFRRRVLAAEDDQHHPPDMPTT